MATRYGHSDAGGGRGDQGERKDSGWRSRQGGDQSREPGRRGEARHRERGEATLPPAGTNTQGELAGIGEAAAASARQLDASPLADAREGRRGEPLATDQPLRMGGPLGSDPRRPHLPEGAQTGETRGSGAGGFDRGVNAKPIGEVHQGAREEDARDATQPGEPGAVSGGPRRT